MVLEKGLCRKLGSSGGPTCKGRPACGGEWFVGEGELWGSPRWRDSFTKGCGRRDNLGRPTCRAWLIRGRVGGGERGGLARTEREVSLEEEGRGLAGGGALLVPRGGLLEWGGGAGDGVGAV